MSGKSTIALVALAVTGVLAACQSGSPEEESASDRGQLAAIADAATVDAVAPDAGGDARGDGRAPPPESCRTAPPDDKPRRECIDYCLADLGNSPSYRCVQAALGRNGGTGTLSDAQMAACGCTSIGEGDGTGVGRRTLYRCPGPPAFSVSVVPNQGTAGIIVLDGAAYPQCMFDLKQPGGPVYDPDPGNACLQCHTIEDPYIRPKLKPALELMPFVLP